MQALPTAPLKVVEATFTLAILIELLDWPTQMRQFHQAGQGRLGRQATKKPLGFAFLTWEGAFPKQPAFWSSPAASVAFTMASTTRSCVDPQRHELLAQGASAPCAPCHRLPAVFWQGLSHLFNVMTRCRTQFLRLATLSFGRCSLWDRRLHHFAVQADAKIRGHRADIRQVTLIQSSQETGDAIARIRDDGCKRYSQAWARSSNGLANSGFEAKVTVSGTCTL